MTTSGLRWPPFWIFFCLEEDGVRAILPPFHLFRVLRLRLVPEELHLTRHLLSSSKSGSKDVSSAHDSSVNKKLSKKCPKHHKLHEGLMGICFKDFNIA
ncbi:hypothetical protein FKM82_031100 [Ascaphus truei]